MKHGDKYRSHYGRGNSVQPVNIQKATLYALRRHEFDATMCMGRWVAQWREAGTLSALLMDERVLEQTARRNYVIYSGTDKYAKPLFIYDEHAALWFENTDILYGKVTTRQRKRMRPAGEVHKFDNLTMEAIALWGFAHVAKRRMDRKQDWRAELRSMLDRIHNKQLGGWSVDIATNRRISAELWRLKHVVNNNQ